jgi:hypothetical protein
MTNILLAEDDRKILKRWSERRERGTETERGERQTETEECEGGLHCQGTEHSP